MNYRMSKEKYLRPYYLGGGSEHDVDLDDDEMGQIADSTGGLCCSGEAAPQWADAPNRQR